MSTVEIISLGGCGGFGMNATLFHAAGTTLLVDFGLGFPHSGQPGVEKLVCDPSPLLERFPDIDALVLTHAHDDHVGAVAHLPRRWRDAPIYGSPFTLAAARDRCEDGKGPLGDQIVLRAGDVHQLGAFALEALPITHSVPQSMALRIETPAGALVHSGDFRLDPRPILGAPTDEHAFRNWGDRGVRLLMIDSTGARRPGRSGAESDVLPTIARLVDEARGQVFASTFSSQLHRVQAFVHAAIASDRTIALLGRRMQQMVRHGIDLGLVDVPPGRIVPHAELEDLPERQRLWLVGGCQGELTSSLSRLSFGTDPRAQPGPEDVLIVSASVVPGNGPLVARLLDRFAQLGVTIRHASDVDDLHVSGHGARDELADLMSWVRPQAVMPIHGDLVNLQAAAQLAGDVLACETVVVQRGEPVIVGQASLGTGPRVELEPRMLDDESRTVSTETVRARRRISLYGLIAVHIAQRASGRIDVAATSRGTTPDWTRADLERQIHSWLAEKPLSVLLSRMTDQETERELELALRRRFRLCARRGPAVALTVSKETNPS